MKGVIALGLLLGVAAIAGVVIYIRARLAKARRLWVSKHGRPVSTEFQAVVRSHPAVPGGEPQYRIITRWRRSATGIYYTFESGDIPFDPQTFAGTRPIIVRIDPRNPRCYVMDTSFLPDSPEPQRGR